MPFCCHLCNTELQICSFTDIQLKFLCLVLLQGYQGMVDGGDYIQQAEWKTVSGIIQKVNSSVTLNLQIIIDCGCRLAYGPS